MFSVAPRSTFFFGGMVVRYCSCVCDTERLHALGSRNVDVQKVK